MLIWFLLLKIVHRHIILYYTALNDADSWKDSWKFCLPAAFVEPKSEQKILRPFRTVNELPFTVGDRLYICTKDSENVEKCLCTSIVSNNDELIQIDLGSTTYELHDLFKPDLSKTVKSVLDEIDLGSSKPFKTKVSHKYRFFIPESFLE